MYGDNGKPSAALMISIFLFVSHRTSCGRAVSLCPVQWSIAKSQTTVHVWHLSILTLELFGLRFPATALWTCDPPHPICSLLIVEQFPENYNKKRAQLESQHSIAKRARYCAQYQKFSSQYKRNYQIGTTYCGDNGNGDSTISYSNNFLVSNKRANAIEQEHGCHSTEKCTEYCYYNPQILCFTFSFLQRKKQKIDQWKIIAIPLSLITIKRSILNLIQTGHFALENLANSHTNTST